jgi:hypothetical protein
MATRTYRLRGDWMRDGYIDNLNRRRELEIIVANGKAYDPELYGYPDDAGRITLTADDCLEAWGASVSFSPDAGELNRIGRDVFKAAL